MQRTGREVAVRAIIYGTLGFRASLEVTEHPRCKELCARLLPWLEQVGLGNHIEAIHREILQSPHASLAPDLRREAYWRGEAAALLGWVIQILDRPDPTERIDPGLLLRGLRILEPTACELLSTAKLRPQDEIDDYCAFCMTVKHQRELSTLDEDGQATLRRIHQSRFLELGLGEAVHRLDGVKVEATTSASTATAVMGLYVVRALTAKWLLGTDE
jgi:hypothetical protein